MRASLGHAIGAALACAALFAAAPRAPAAAPPGQVRFPSAAVPDAAALQAALLDPAVTEVVFERGTHPFGATLFVFRRSHVTLSGATGDPRDATIDSSATPALRVEQAVDVTLRGLTVRSTAAFGRAVLLNAVPSPEIESFAEDVRLERCAFEGYVGVQATVRARDLTPVGCRFEVTQAGGVGLLWEDGPGLFVTRSRFAAAPGAAALAAVFVRGAQSDASEGERAHRVILTRNAVDGDFATGFDFADVTDLRLSGNRLAFPGPLLAGGGGGRVGIVVRRAAASAVTDDFELRRNDVHRAHYGLWLLDAGEGRVLENDLRSCGSPIPDSRFADTGGAVRLNLQSGLCDVRIQRNDLRDLRSPLSAPAVSVVPAGSESACFSPEDRNRVDRGRDLYLGAAKR